MRRSCLSALIVFFALPFANGAAGATSCDRPPVGCIRCAGGELVCSGPPGGGGGPIVLNKPEPPALGGGGGFNRDKFDILRDKFELNLLPKDRPQRRIID